MMLVNADAVESEPVRIFQFIEVSVVERMALNRVVKRIRQNQRYGFVFGGCGKIESRVGHQMKKEEFHERNAPMKLVTVDTNSEVRSMCGRWPHCGITSRRELGIRD